MHATLTDLVGLVASGTSFLLWLPQAVRVWRFRDDADALRSVALGTQVLSFVSSIAYLSYGLLLHAFWVGAPAWINAPVALATIWLVVRSRRHAHEEELSAQARRHEAIPA